MAGDLDPALSQRHLTTLKRAYLKLRFLVDAGCVLVGHGLKTDLRMLNIAVPPAQARRGPRLAARGCVLLPHLMQVPATFLGHHRALYDQPQSLRLARLPSWQVHGGWLHGSAG